MTKEQALKEIDAIQAIVTGCTGRTYGEFARLSEAILNVRAFVESVGVVAQEPQKENNKGK